MNQLLSDCLKSINCVKHRVTKLSVCRQAGLTVGKMYRITSYNPESDRIIEHQYSYGGGSSLKNYSNCQEVDTFHKVRDRVSFVKDFLEPKVSKTIPKNRSAQGRLVKASSEKLNTLEVLFLSPCTGDVSLGLMSLSKEGIIELAMNFLELPALPSIFYKDLL